MTTKRTRWFAMTRVLLFANFAIAQQYPMLDAVANGSVQKHRQSSCAQL